MASPFISDDKTVPNYSGSDRLLQSGRFLAEKLSSATFGPDMNAGSAALQKPIGVLDLYRELVRVNSKRLAGATQEEVRRDQTGSNVPKPFLSFISGAFLAIGDLIARPTPALDDPKEQSEKLLKKIEKNPSKFLGTATSTVLGRAVASPFNLLGLVLAVFTTPADAATNKIVAVLNEAKKKKKQKEEDDWEEDLTPSPEKLEMEAQEKIYQEERMHHVAEEQEETLVAEEARDQAVRLAEEDLEKTTAKTISVEAASKPTPALDPKKSQRTSEEASLISEIKKAKKADDKQALLYKLTTVQRELTKMGVPLSTIEKTGQVEVSGKTALAAGKATPKPASAQSKTTPIPAVASAMKPIVSAHADTFAHVKTWDDYAALKTRQGEFLAKLISPTADKKLEQQFAKVLASAEEKSGNFPVIDREDLQVQHQIEKDIEVLKHALDVYRKTHDIQTEKEPMATRTKKSHGLHHIPKPQPSKRTQ